jgi:predicted RNA binding protein YcfA (HicA-like mRNA interferase family)
VNRKKLLFKLSKGEIQNVAFSDLTNLVEGFGFNLDRISGSHHIYSHTGIPELINLQNVKGKAKPYQIWQLLKLIERYNLKLEVRRD